MPPSLACYLYKRARSSGRNWKKRWFVFEEHLGNWSISYYKSEKDFRSPKKKALGAVGLETANPDATVMPVAAAKDYSLEILPADGTPALVVAAEDSVRYGEMLALLDAFAHKCESGYLYKRARKSGRNWKKRWFVADFTSRVIRIYEDIAAVAKPNKKGTVGNANDIIPFSHHCTVHSSGLRKHCMELQFGSDDLSLFVAADDHEEFVRWRLAFETLVSGGGHGLDGAAEMAAPGHATDDGGESVASQLMKSAMSRAELVKTLSRHGSALLSFAHNNNNVATMPPTPTGRSSGLSEPSRPRHSVPPPRTGRGPPARKGRGPPKRVTRRVTHDGATSGGGARPPPPLPSAAARMSAQRGMQKHVRSKSKSIQAPKPGRGGLLDSITEFGGGLKHVSPRVSTAVGGSARSAPRGPAHLRGLGGAKNGLKSSKIPRKSEVARRPSTNLDLMRDRLKAHRSSIAGSVARSSTCGLSDDDDEDFGDDSDDFLSD
jgi:hypothetical protein